MSEQGRINFSARLQNSDLRRDAEQAKKIFKNFGDRVAEEGKRIDETFKNIGKAAAAYFTATTFFEFGKSVVNVRKEVESLEISFTTLLGSESKAKALFSEINEFAVKTPMQLNDLAKGAQTLLGFGISAERVMPILKQLGDVSMGNRDKFNSLTLAFAQATSAGKLQGQDLLQMINAGFNPLNEIAKKTGKSIGELKDDMSKGKISANDLAEALESATKQGGLFYGMLEKQSKGIEGSLSNLEGAWQNVQNKIGESLQGEFVEAVELATVAVEHYEDFVKVILSLAAAYGTYKAVLMAAYVVQKAQMLSENIRLIMMFRKELGLLTATQQAFNITAMKNPYWMIGAAIASVLVGIAMFVRKQSDAQNVIEECNDRIKEQEAELSKLEKNINAVLDAEKEAAKSTAEEINKIEILTNTIHDETASIDDRNRAIKELQGIVPNYHAELDKEGRLHRENKTAIDKHIESLNKLALAKALQSKREEFVAQKVNAELERRANVKRAQDQQKDIDSKQSTLDRAEATQQAIKDSNDKQIERANSQRSRAGLPFMNQGRNASGFDAYKSATAAVGIAKDELKASKLQMQVINNDIAISDKAISSAEENLARLDEMMKEYKNYLPKKESTPIDPKDAKRFAKYTTLQGQQDVEAARQAKDLEFATKQAEIDAMKEGSDKVLEQMKLNHAKQIEELEREKADYLQRKVDNARELFEANPANKDKVFDASGITLTPDEVQMFIQRENYLKQSQSREGQELVEGQKKALYECLKQYGEYQQQRDAIAQLWSKKIAEAETQEEKTAFTNQMNKELSALDIEAKKSTSSIARLFDDMSEKTVKDMRSIARAGEEAYQFLKEGKWDAKKGEELGISKETFETLRKSPEELEKIRKGIKEITDAADKSDSALNKMSNGLKQIFDSDGNSNKLEKGLEMFKGGLSDCLAVGGFLSDTLSGLADAFGSDTLGGIAEGINVAMDAANAAMSGAEVGKMFGPIGAAIGGAIGLVSSLAGSFAKIHDAKNEKRIQKLQEQVEALEKSFDKLSKSIERAYSKDASNLIEQQNKLLQQQKILIQQQIKEEEDKKKTDHDRIKEWKAQIEEIDALIADNKEKAIDAIFGEDLKSAIDNFSSALADAWANGTNKSKAARDTVKKMMQQMVTESIKAMIQSSGKMEEIRKKLQEFYADNVLSGWEQDYIYKMADELQKQIDSQYGWADGLMGGGESANQNSTKRGFEAMNQESADELNGRFTAVQLNTEQSKVALLDIGVDVKAIRGQMQANREAVEEMKNVSIIAISHLETISRNTHELFEINERLERIEKNTRNL